MVLLALVKGWIGVRGVLIALVLIGVVGCLYLAVLDIWVPGSMTDCQPLEAAPPQVRYDCVDRSSDDPDYHREFIIQGRAGWPVMRVVETHP